MTNKNFDITTFVTKYLDKYKTMPNLDLLWSVQGNCKPQYLQLLGNCACISYLGPNRLIGPNDNVVTKGEATLKKIFNLDYFTEIVETAPDIEDKPKSFSTDSSKIYKYKSVIFYHNNPQEQKFLQYFKHRLNCLYTFYELLKQSSDYYFLITLNEYDIDNNHQLTKNFYNILSYLKHLNILDKVIFVQMRSTVNPNKIEWNNCWAENFDAIAKQYKLKAITILDAKFDDSGQTHNQFLQKVTKLLKSE